MIDVINNTKQLLVEDLQENFGQEFEDVLPSREPVQIIKATRNAILVSEVVWRGVSEALSLFSISGVQEIVRSGTRLQNLHGN